MSRAVNKQRVLSRYKFYLAFENNVIRDYVSEKVFDGLLSGTASRRARQNRPTTGITGNHQQADMQG